MPIMLPSAEPVGRSRPQAAPLLLSLSLCLSSDLLRFVLIDCYLQVLVLLAFSKEGTRLFQRLELLLGVGRLIHLEVKLAEIFMRAPMTGIDLQGHLVMLHRFVEGAEFAITVAEQGVSVGVFRVFLNGFRLISHGRLEFLRLDSFPSGGIIWIFRLRLWLSVEVPSLNEHYTIMRCNYIQQRFTIQIT